MLASTMQFSKFGQRLFKPTLARENQAVRGKEAQKNGCPYLQDPTVCHVFKSSPHKRSTPQAVVLISEDVQKHYVNVPPLSFLFTTFA